MSSQPTPGVVPPPLRVRRRSLAGPVVLIVLGVVFLLGNLGYVTWPRIGVLFAHYWPVLIILWGLVKLLEHMRARREGYVAPGIGGGGMVLLVLLVIAGLSASEAMRVNWRALDVDGNIFGPFGESHNYTDELQQEFPVGDNLRVVSDRGEVTVLPWDENRIKVEVQKRVWADSEKNAQEANEATRPTISIAGNLVTVNANTASAGQRRVDTDLTIFIPRKAAAEVSTARGKVTVRDRNGDLKLNASHGDVELAAIQGNVTLNLRHGSLRADNIIGDLDCTGRIDDVNVSNVTGMVKLNGDYFGTTNVTHAAKGVRFNSSRTDMEIARLDGDMTMESDDLRARGLSGPVRVVTRSKNIRLEDVSGDVQLHDTNGEIEIHPKAPLGNITVENRKGEVRVVLPAQASFKVEARTYRGDISTDFSELKINSDQPEATVNGTVGSGAAQLRLSTEHADIEIRKG